MLVIFYAIRSQERKESFNWRGFPFINEISKPGVRIILHPCRIPLPLIVSKYKAVPIGADNIKIIYVE